jgi:hypothetical protein
MRPIISPIFAEYRWNLLKSRITLPSTARAILFGDGQYRLGTDLPSLIWHNISPLIQDFPG